MPFVSPNATRTNLHGHLTALATAVLALLLALPFAFCGKDFFDELTYLDHAKNILHGQVIYRDFFEFLTPMSSWLGALLFVLTGPSLFAARVLMAIFVGTSAGLLYYVARALELPRRLAVFTGLLCAGAIYTPLPGWSHHWLGWPFLWVTVLATLKGIGAAGERSPWIFAGLGVGCTVLTLQSDGLALFAVVIAWIVADAWLGGAGVARSTRRLSLVVMGIGITLVPVVGYFLWQGALGAAIAHVWSWPRQHYHQAGGINDVKYMSDLAALVRTNTPEFTRLGWTLATFFVLYLLILPLGLVFLTLGRVVGAFYERFRFGTRWSDATARVALVSILQLAFLGVLVRGRADYAHDIYYAAPSLLLAMILAWRWAQMLVQPAYVVIRWLPLVSLVTFGAVAIFMGTGRVRTEPGMWLRWDGPDGAFRADPVIVYLHSRAKPGDRLAALPVGAIYSFYGLPSVSRYTMMFTPEEGYFNAREYASYWQDIAHARPRFIVVAPFSSPAIPPRLPVKGYGSPKAIEYGAAGARLPAFVFELEEANAKR
jgi:hypothetical protein